MQRVSTRHHGKGIKNKSVAAAVNEMIDKKTLKDVSDVNQIAPDDVASFFDCLKLSPRSYNNFLQALRTFFGFAQKRGWLSEEADLLARVEKRSEKCTSVKIFTAVDLTCAAQQCVRRSRVLSRTGFVRRIALCGNLAA